MWLKFLYVLVVLLTYIDLSYGAKILAFMPSPSYSHQIAYRSFFIELSKRGHELTLFTTDPTADDNLTNFKQIDLSESYKLVQRHELNKILTSGNITIFQLVTKLLKGIEDLSRHTICRTEINQLLNDKYDLVIFEYLVPTPIAVAHKLGCPFIGVVSMDVAWYGHLTLGNPIHPVANPDQNLPFTKNLTFKERLISTVYSTIFQLILNFYAYPMQDRVIEECLGSTPSLQQLQKNISMLFINSNPLFHNVRALGPATINVAGKLHMNNPPKQLPQDLQEILDGAGNGVIYFSLGSNVKSKNLGNRTQRIILEALSELPYTVLWKYDENLSVLPENVHIRKWYPQQDVLRHPHVKLFITQGGLQSLEEAVYNHIPLIGMPFFGDQFYNIKQIVDQRFGLSLDYKSLEKEQFKQTIFEIINNPIYRRNVKEMADLSLDQPMTGLEKAIWWTEYVIRNKGAKLLENPIKDLPLYQYLMLDILLTFVFIIILLLVIVYIFVKYSVKLLKFVIFRRRNKVKLQ